MKFVPFRCKSRFCPTCDVKYCQERSTSMAFKLINCTHRHCVFTIDEELRHFFLDDRTLLDCLFQAALLNMLEARIGPSFKKVKAHIYQKDNNGFYVYAKPNLCRNYTKWRNDILLSFGYDPLKCSNCNHQMVLVELYHNHKKVPLDELYERTMRKYKCRSA